LGQSAHFRLLYIKRMSLWRHCAIYCLTTWSVIEVALFVWMYGERLLWSRHGPWIPRTMSPGQEQFLMVAGAVMFLSLLTGVGFSVIALATEPSDRRSWGTLALAVAVVGAHVYLQGMCLC